MRVTAIMNLKGGTAKTVTAINMAAILARDYNERVLLVDADSQCNLTEFMTAGLWEDSTLDGIGLCALLKGQNWSILGTALDTVDILPASDELMELDISRAKEQTVDVMALEDLRALYAADGDGRYDHMLIDCPPSFSAAAMAALIAADDVVIPMKLDAFGIRGMANLLYQVQCMRKINPGLRVAGILPTMYYDTQQMRSAEASLAASGLPVFSHIRRSTKVDDMTFAQLPLTKSSPRSAACHDYRRFVAEYLKGGEQDGV